jgi:lipopolysaccharide export system permease protein
MTVAVFTFVLLLVNILKEILPLLVNGQVGFQFVAEAFGLLVPFVWVFALPMGMLTATLLIFGRFSADQELTAVRASGVSLIAIVSPILLLSLALCALSALVNLDLGPRCRVAYNTLKGNLRFQLSNIQLPEGRYITAFENFTFFIGKNRRGALQDVMVFQLKDETNLVRTYLAPSGRLESDTPNQRLLVHLYDIKLVDFSQGHALMPTSSDEVTLELPLGTRKREARPPGLDDMTFAQLSDELSALRQTNLPISPRNHSREQLRAMKQQWEKWRKNYETSVLFQMNRRVAFSFACFGFTLIGIPLGIRVHRRETNIGIAMALVLVAVYYGFILLAQSLDSRPECVPYLIVWLPNFFFQAIGAVLLWRANRGT